MNLQNVFALMKDSGTTILRINIEGKQNAVVIFAVGDSARDLTDYVLMLEENDSPNTTGG